MAFQAPVWPDHRFDFSLTWSSVWVSANPFEVQLSFWFQPNPPSFPKHQLFSRLLWAQMPANAPQSQTPEQHACGFEECRCVAQAFWDMFYFNVIPPKNSTSVVGKYPAASSVRQHFKAPKASWEEPQESQRLNPVGLPSTLMTFLSHKVASALQASGNCWSLNLNKP